jgi:glycosyltransferase involved in cell wall biosynthesis
MTIASTGPRGLPSVFVVVPCYNYGRFLEACVRSVLSQEGVEPRVLVIDDASKDNTADIGERLAREDHRVQFIRHVKNAGHIATFNQGIDQATGDYFLLLSADDYLLPGALGRAAAVMEKHPEVGFTFGPARVEGQAVAGALAPPAEGYLGAARVLSGLEFVRPAQHRPDADRGDPPGAATKGRRLSRHLAPQRRHGNVAPPRG